MKTYFLDANAILRYLLEDNVKQAADIEQLLETARADHCKLVVIPETLVECIHVLEKVYGFTKHEAIRYISSVAKAPYLEVRQRSILLDALKLYEHVNIDFVDIFLFLIAEQEAAEVFSFDKDFTKLKRSVR